MLARLLAPLLAALLLAPGAVAFRGNEADVVIAYPQEGAPVSLALGELSVAGRVGGGLLLVDVSPLRLERVPSLTVAELDGNGPPRNSTYRDVTVVVHAGDVLWPFAGGVVATLDVSSAYGMGLALPQAPLPAAEGGAGPGFLVGGQEVGGGLSWSPGATAPLLLDASVTLLAADGSTVPGWDRRAVNAGVSPASPDGLGGMDTLMEAQGPFGGSVSAHAVGAALGTDADVALRAAPAAEEAFGATLDALAALGGSLGAQEEGSPFSADSPLRALAGLAPVLNGAVLILPDAQGGLAEAPEPLVSRVGESDFGVGPFTMLRGQEGMTVAWREGEMRVQGQPAVVMGRDGFATRSPPVLFGLPLLAILLWLVAAGAVVLFFVKRPPKGDTPLWLRLCGWAANLLALVLVFLLWDWSFAQTFGTSFLRELGRAETAGGAAGLGILLALELLPWGLAALFFALPVRIAAAIGLRYLGRGKGLKGFATAASLLALGVLGPLHALWLVNLVVARAAGMLPALGGA